MSYGKDKIKKFLEDEARYKPNQVQYSGYVQLKQTAFDLLHQCGTEEKTVWTIHEIQDLYNCLVKMDKYVNQLRDDLAISEDLTKTFIKFYQDAICSKR
jgi:hypothetical protein